jgi:hypothetical protein
MTAELMTALPMTLRDDRFAELHQWQIVITTCRVILRRRSSVRLFIANGLVALGVMYIFNE